MLLTDCLKSSQKKVIVMEVQFTSSPLTDTSLSQAPLLPEFVPAFLYSLYFTLCKMDISLRQILRCKENHFYSLPFRQAEASIYQRRCHFNQPQKLFDQQNRLHSSSVIGIPQKSITCPSGKLKTEFTSPIAKSASSWLSETTFSARWTLSACPKVSFLDERGDCICFTF